MLACPACRGTGEENEGVVCRVCLGHGAVFVEWRACEFCAGKGYRPTMVSSAFGAFWHNAACSVCMGTGVKVRPLPFTEPLDIIIPVSALVDGGEDERERGVVAGLLVLFAQQTRETGNPPGDQVTRLVEQGGVLIVARDGVWHRIDEETPPARVLKFANDDYTVLASTEIKKG